MATDIASEESTHWKNLVFTDQGRQRFKEVQDLLDQLTADEHPHADAIREEFNARLNYLDRYGGTVSETDSRPRFRVTLGRDWARHSFSVTWEQLDLTSGEYRYAWNGGLIWHGGPEDPLCVSITPTWFGLHT